MDHDERLRLAADLTERLLDRHRAAIVAVGVHGATARGEDGEESDLDLAVVTVGPEAEVPDRYLRHRGIVVDLGAIAADAYLEEAGRVLRPGGRGALQVRHPGPLPWAVDLAGHLVHAAQGRRVWSAAWRGTRIPTHRLLEAASRPGVHAELRERGRRHLWVLLRR